MSIYRNLKTIYGINTKQSFFLLKKLGFSKTLNTQLSADQLNSINALIKKLDIKTELILKISKKKNLKNLTKIRINKGLRRLKHLPVRGQRTKTNSKTAKKLNKVF